MKETIIQFGTGNFLRGFVDYMIDIANEQGKFDGDIVLIKPIEFGNLEATWNRFTPSPSTKRLTR